MTGIDRATQSLPQDFIEVVKKVYSNNYLEVLQKFDNDLPTTFRVNTLKSSQHEVLEQLNRADIKVKDGPFISSFIVVDDKKELITRTDLVNSGKIYVQELASQIPPLLIDPKENEYILDLCAAPGSKTTRLCALSNNTAKILANEKSFVRYQKLLFNLNLQGCKNVKTINENGIFINKKFSELNNFFNKVMLDVPCSSEGRFYTQNPKTYKYWNKHKIKEMSSIQKGLLVAGISMPKPGGTLIYSTCTLNPYENEQNIDWLIRNVSNIAIKPIDLKITNIKNGLTKFENLEFSKELEKTIRVIPNGEFGGFYIAKIIKL